MHHKCCTYRSVFNLSRQVRCSFGCSDQSETSQRLHNTKKLFAAGADFNFINILEGKSLGFTQIVQRLGGQILWNPVETSDVSRLDQ